MKIAIITTGDEIMSGNIVDSNCTWIADRCWRLNHKVVWNISIGDDEDAIVDACLLAAERADVVFVTGGLGATVDDITLAASTKAFGSKMIFNEDVWSGIEGYFKKTGRECTENNKRQAYLPEGGVPLQNRVGTAPGVQVKFENTTFFFLPGVPKEMYQIFEDSILPWLKKNSKGEYHQKFLKCFGMPEASLDERIKDIELGDVRLSFRVTFPEIKIKLVDRLSFIVDRKDATKQLDEVEKKIRERIGGYIFGTDDDTMESVVGDLLKKKKMRLAVAESCTGGYIANMLTNVPGASEWFERGIVSYSNESKIQTLGVNEATIKKHGAVSEACAKEMAAGLLKKSGADIAVAVTGIAGPSGGTKEKPVGTVYIALATPEKIEHSSHVQPRSREWFKKWVAYQALDMVRRRLELL